MQEICQVAVSISSGSLQVKPGTILFINPEQPIKVTAASNESLHSYLITFDILTKREQTDTSIIYDARKTEWLVDGKLTTDYSHRITGLSKELTDLCRQEANTDLFRQQMCFYEILHLLRKDAVMSNSRLEDNWTQVVISYMEEHYQEKISRELLAQMSGFHPDYFSIKFKQETGHSYSDYLTRIRMNKAKEQLAAEITDSLDVIAHSVGYTDGAYLNRKFKQQFGITPRKYRHIPKRIVTIEYVGELLAIGMKPIGAFHSNRLSNLARLHGELEGVSTFDFALDNISRLQPDLIIVPDWFDKIPLHQLSQISPTKVVDFEHPVRRLRTIASMLDKQHEAERVLSSYDKKGAQAREQISRRLASWETVAVYEIWADGIWVFGNISFGRGVYNLYETLGMRAPDKVRQEIIEANLWWKKVSLEELTAYAADHMFVSVYEAGGASRYAEEIKRSKIWTKLPAYQNKRIYEIDMNLMHPGDILTLNRQLDVQVEALLSSSRI
ncbi:AraC family transcriptional regulator [Brevibacillus reuszeri]|uniref:AraC family transcriptional regulator n=1 Tax=Brevibacillus reuszeri TaxID=54915 RepID=UPI0028992A00|nr:AraC family transcriptional regulator [Brevibacillus reuszeri]